MGVLLPLPVVDLLNKVKLLPKPCAVRYYPTGTPNVPSGCPSLVYLADMHCIYNSYVPCIDQEIAI